MAVRWAKLWPQFRVLKHQPACPEDPFQPKGSTRNKDPKSPSARQDTMSEEAKDDDVVAEDAAAKVSKQPPPAGEDPQKPDPTRYGDWEINGRCIDF